MSNNNPICQPGDLVYFPHKEYFARVIRVQKSNYGPQVTIQKIFHINGKPNKRQKRFITVHQNWLTKIDQKTLDEWSGRIKILLEETNKLNEQDDPRLFDV